MIDIPPLTQDLLEELRAELGGCDFSGENQRAFLGADDFCDVQAVPGNGKTTLLVAKLALLSRSWTSRTQGVCVISHTNAAREEVENKLFSHPTASVFLRYPHFVGTVMAFIDRFIALPYLRGLGWTVQRIDDDVFSAMALARWHSYPALVKYSRINNGRQLHALQGFVSGLELADNFEAVPGTPPQRLAVRGKARQPGSQSATGIALEELKGGLVQDGFYRYADMTALAQQALERKPALIERLRQRFPLVLLDEAQDTNGAQLALLDRVFGEDCAYQRLGDQNQTLYEDDELGPDDYWRAGAGVIPLNETHRFGAEISAFASRLTVRAVQRIEGNPGVPCRRSLILFDNETIGDVLPAYVGEVRAHWGQGDLAERDIRAVASRHNPTTDIRGERPKTLVEYCPHYRSSGGRQGRMDTLCAPLRQATLLHETYAAPADIVDLITGGIVTLLRHQGVRDVLGQPIGKRNLWAYLASRDSALPLAVRRLMRDRVLHAHAAWNAGHWATFCDDLRTMLGIGDDQTPAAAQFMEFVDAGAMEANAQAPPQSRTVFTHDNVSVRLGSIHSVKGKTVDLILILETEVWRQNARAMDLGTVLPHAFGLENQDFNAVPVQLAAATNIFVAATRPREILTCAMRRAAATQQLIGSAAEQGWNILDLTA